MKLKIFGLLSMLIGMSIILYSISIEPDVKAQLTLNTVNGSNVDYNIQRSYEKAVQSKMLGSLMVIIGVASFFYSIIRTTAMIIVIMMMVGCERDPQPEYVLINTHETAFVIHLEGDLSSQVKFDSEEAVNKMKVPLRRILITTRKETISGKTTWLPTISVIKVDRSPVTRKWESYDPSKDTGIWTESGDSVGFGIGFSVTASILEEDSAKFLYRYSGNSLATVMDNEVKARITSAVSEFSSKHNMDDLRRLKSEMNAYIKDDVVPYFKERGINITTIGMYGGFAYENNQIQDSIDKVFIAQQEKNVAAALLDAQKDKNERVRQEGEGEAQKLLEIAKGKAEAEKIEAQGKASGIELVAKAAKEAGQDPLFLQLRTLEAITEQIKRWDGKYPTFMLNGNNGNNPLLMIQIPTPELIEKK